MPRTANQRKKDEALLRAVELINHISDLKKGATETYRPKMATAIEKLRKAVKDCTEGNLRHAELTALINDYARMYNKK